MIGKAKLAVYLVAALGGAGAVIGLLWVGHNHGVRTVEAQYQSALIQEQARQRDLVAELEEARRARQRVITETIEVIRHVPDLTGCNADTTLSDELDRMCAQGNRAAC